MARGRIKTVLKEEWVQLLEGVESLSDLLPKLGLSQSGYTKKRVVDRLKELGLEWRSRNKRSWTDEDLEGAVKNNISMSATLAELGLKHSGGMNRSIRQKIAVNGLSTDHWLGQAHNKGKTWVSKIARPLEEILVENSTYTSTVSLKRRLLKEGLLDPKCNICGITEWRAGPLVLVLDHINGTHWDNRVENLRLLCPNCNSQQRTFCRGNSRPYHPPVDPRRIRVSKIRMLERILRKCKCGADISLRGKSGLCRKCFLRVKVQKQKQAAREDPKNIKISEMRSAGESYEAIGRHFGISGVAVKKRLKRL